MLHSIQHNVFYYNSNKSFIMREKREDGKRRTQIETKIKFKKSAADSVIVATLPR